MNANYLTLSIATYAYIVWEIYYQNVNDITVIFVVELLAGEIDMNAPHGVKRVNNFSVFRQMWNGNSWKLYFKKTTKHSLQLFAWRMYFKEDKKLLEDADR